MAHLHEKNGHIETARKHFSRSLVLRSRMVDLFMDMLKELEIEFVVAPYEADAQISFMVLEGIADFAISEDSDLIAFGCPKIVLKLNPLGGCDYFTFDHFYSCEEKGQEISTLQDLSRD